MHRESENQGRTAIRNGKNRAPTRTVARINGFKSLKNESKRFDWQRQLATIISIVALSISIFSTFHNYSSARDQSTRDAIGQAYEKWLAVSRMQIDDRSVAHVFALPEQYSNVRALVVTSSKLTEGSTRAGLTLHERGVAIYLFTLYEYTLFQLDQARSAGDPRAEFYQAVVDYETSRALRNPRLLYWWSEGGLSNYFEKSTIAHFQRYVLDGKISPSKSQMDATGPFGN